MNNYIKTVVQLRIYLSINKEIHHLAADKLWFIVELSICCCHNDSYVKKYQRIHARTWYVLIFAGAQVRDCHPGNCWNVPREPARPGDNIGKAGCFPEFPRRISARSAERSEW